ncbi:hypothetical protein D3C86_2038000 [compost metagenome]
MQDQFYERGDQRLLPVFRELEFDQRAADAEKGGGDDGLAHHGEEGFGGFDKLYFEQ